MDGGTILALVVLSIVALAAVAGMGWSVHVLSRRVSESNDLVAKIALTRPWHVIEINEDKSLRRIEHLESSESGLKTQLAAMEEQLREERARHRVDLMRVGGHPEVPDPVADPEQFNDDTVDTIGERHP